MPHPHHHSGADRAAPPRCAHPRTEQRAGYLALTLRVHNTNPNPNPNPNPKQVHAAVSLGVTYRAVYASGAWRGLGTASGEISVPEVMAAVDAATASAPRDRSRLEEMVRRAV